MFDKHHVLWNILLMELTFTNRTAELKELESAATAGGLLVVFGRRRVGKTRLLAHWLKPRHGLYSQAIEGAKEIQLEQVFRDIKNQLSPLPSFPSHRRSCLNYWLCRSSDRFSA